MYVEFAIDIAGVDLDGMQRELTAPTPKGLALMGFQLQTRAAHRSRSYAF